MACIVFGRVGHGDDMKICPCDEDDRPCHINASSSHF